MSNRIECCGNPEACTCSERGERSACYLAGRIEAERRGDRIMADHPGLSIDDLREAVSHSAACTGRARMSQKTRSESPG